MSYQVLARKWRPRSFLQMVGQEHVLRMLSNALEQKRLHHAYLFTGTRGVGKTTLGRIFAKCLNCELDITPNPCNSCKNCTAIDEGRFLDLLEIDAASRTKVEDTRELLDNVQYQPNQGRFKIYLIDEVHMLSGHSFNALLKTLEEPPPHVKFILATTDPKRLPVTILSRCLQFNLKRVPTEQIAQHLLHICGTENIPVEVSALPLLAQAADGSMRDALSLLDQTIAYCAGKITTQDTKQMLGSVDQEVLFHILSALADQDGIKILQEIHRLADYAVDFNQALEDLISILHHLSIAQIVPEAENETHIISLAKRFSTEDLQLYYQIALIGRRDLPLAANLQQGFEMALLRMLAFKLAPEPLTKNNHSLPASSTQSQQTSQKANPKQPASVATSAAAKSTQTVVTPASNMPTVAAHAPLSSNKQTIAAHTFASVASKQSMTESTGSATLQQWSELLAKLELTGMTQALAANCSLVAIKDNEIVLALAKKHEPMLNKKLAERIEQTITIYFQKPMKLTINIITTEIETPLKEQLHAQNLRQNKATEAIKNDSGVQAIVDLFNATVTAVIPQDTSDESSIS